MTFPFSFIELAFVLPIAKLGDALPCDLVGRKLPFVLGAIGIDIHAVAVLEAPIQFPAIHASCDPPHSHLPLPGEVLDKLAVELCPVAFDDAPALLPADPPLALIPPLGRLQSAFAVFLPAFPFPLVIGIQLEVVHLPRALLLVVFELAHVRIAIFVVVDAFDGLTVQELPSEELAVLE